MTDKAEHLCKIDSREWMSGGLPLSVYPDFYASPPHTTSGTSRKSYYGEKINSIPWENGHGDVWIKRYTLRGIEWPMPSVSRMVVKHPRASTHAHTHLFLKSRSILQI